MSRASAGATGRGIAPLPVEARARVVYDAPRPPPPAYVQHYQPVVVEYAYARLDAPPLPARQPQYDARHAGRDANGFLTWPGKRP